LAHFEIIAASGGSDKEVEYEWPGEVTNSVYTRLPMGRMCGPVFSEDIYPFG